MIVTEAHFCLLLPTFIKLYVGNINQRKQIKNTKVGGEVFKNIFKRVYIAVKQYKGPGGYKKISQTLWMFSYAMSLS